MLRHEYPPQTLRMVWPIVCRRLEGLPNLNASQLFEDLCIQFPGRSTPKDILIYPLHLCTIAQGESG